MKPLKKIIKDDVYGNTYYVYVGDEKKADKWFTSKVKGYAGKTLDGDYGCTLAFNSHNYGIFFSQDCWKDKDFIEDTIAHECFHATIRGLAAHGVNLDIDNQEAHAYTLGWLVREVHKLRKKK